MSGLLHIPSRNRARQMRASKTCHKLSGMSALPERPRTMHGPGRCKVRMMPDQRPHTSRSSAEWAERSSTRTSQSSSKVARSPYV